MFFFAKTIWIWIVQKKMERVIWMSWTIMTEKLVIIKQPLSKGMIFGVKTLFFRYFYGSTRAWNMLFWKFVFNFSQYISQIKRFSNLRTFSEFSNFRAKYLSNDALVERIGWVVSEIIPDKHTYIQLKKCFHILFGVE